MGWQMKQTETERGVRGVLSKRVRDRQPENDGVMW